MKPLVAIVGRPNVGKSTLFNRLLGRRKAIATDESGVTRDLNFADVEEKGLPFTLVDTGGFEPKPEGEIMKKVKEQSAVAIEDADLIIFLMDVREGATHQDKEIVEILRKSGKPVLYAINKVDSPKLTETLGEFYALGIKKVFPVSAEHGEGIYELLDALLEGIPKPEGEVAGVEDASLRVALVGRPNAGKSSILNKFLNKERSIVSSEPGTTRDSVDTPFEYESVKYTFIDTAGIRKKNRVSRTVETYCVMEAIRSIDRCHVACLIIDAKSGVGAQDEKIAGVIERRGKGCVIVVNKWDIVEKDTNTTLRFTESIHDRIPFLSYAPVVFVSALTGKRLPNILEAVQLVVEQLNSRVTTNALNKIFDDIKTRKPPPLYRNKPVKLYYITQTGVRPPTFVAFCNYPEGVVEHYRRFIVNRLRESLNIENVPIRLYFRQRER